MNNLHEKFSVQPKSFSPDDVIESVNSIIDFARHRGKMLVRLEVEYFDGGKKVGVAGTLEDKHWKNRIAGALMAEERLTVVAESANPNHIIDAVNSIISYAEKKGKVLKLFKVSSSDYFSKTAVCGILEEKNA